ncbi:MAG: metalloregulator ArsR/SmtB family transcription factor [Candidatus Bathyarchaeia archaeon]
MKKGLSQTCFVFFSVISNPTRLAILENLLRSPMNVSQLTSVLKQSQSMISHNLKPLLRCGFIRVERRGKERFYSLNGETVELLFKIVENHSQKYCPTMGICPRRWVG